MSYPWLVLLFTGGSSAASLRDLEGPPASPVTETELGWIELEVAPAVERVAGRKFKVLPPVVLADAATIGQVVYEEQVHLLRGVDGVADAAAEESARSTATAVSPAFAGKYGFLDRKLYISVDGLEDALVLEGEPDWLLRPLIRIVVAHELTHALQDQYLDLESVVQSAPTADAIMAINCAVEGDAVWVHEQVGAEEGLGDAVRLMATLLGSDDPIRRRMDPDKFYNTYVYGLGRDFIAEHAAHGGTDEVWAVLEHPPLATAMIVAPDTWDQPVDAVDPDARHAMRRASRRLASKDWRAVDSSMGDFDVRDQLIRAGADSHLADDLSVGWNSRLVGGAMAGVEVQVLRFKSADTARAFVEDMLTQAQDQARESAGDPFILADAGRFDRVDSDRSGRERFTVSMFGPADSLGRIWVARGADVVQIVMVNAPAATDRKVAQAIDQVFRSLNR